MAPLPEKQSTMAWYDEAKDTIDTIDTTYIPITPPHLRVEEGFIPLKPLHFTITFGLFIRGKTHRTFCLFIACFNAVNRLPVLTSRFSPSFSLL